VNLFRLYLPLADSWRIFDNSKNGDFSLIAAKFESREVAIERPALWKQLKKTYDEYAN
jgi:predicted ABC-type ATPase